MFLVFLLLAPSHAQEARSLRKPAADAISDNVKKQSDSISADAQRRLDLERSRTEYTQAYAQQELTPFLSQNIQSQQIDLDLKKLRGYWQKKKEINDGKWMELEHRLENARRRELQRRASVLIKWDNAMNDPRARMHAVRNGRLFNVFLEQIEVHSGFSSSGDLSPGLISGLKTLDKNMLRGLKFEVGAPGGAIEVSLMNPLPSILDTCPYLLLDPEFKEQREKVIALATKVLGPHETGEAKYSASEEYCIAFEALTKRFYLKYPTRRNVPVRQWHRLEAVEMYFRKLDQTVSLAADGAVNGAVRPVYASIYPPEQRNIATICQFLIQNGIRFAKPSVDGEFVYDQLFPQFRELMIRLEVEPTQAWLEDSLINLDLQKNIGNQP